MKIAEALYKNGKVKLISESGIEEYELYPEDTIDFITEKGLLAEFTAYLQEVKKRFGEDTAIQYFSRVSKGRLRLVYMGPSLVYKNVKCVYMGNHESDMEMDLYKIKVLKSIALRSLTNKKHSSRELVQYRFVGKNIGKLVKEFAEFVYDNSNSDIVEELKKVDIKIGTRSDNSIRISGIYSLSDDVVFEITLNTENSRKTKYPGIYKSLVAVKLDVDYDKDIFIDYFTNYLTEELDPLIALFFIGNIPYLMGYVQGLSSKIGLEIPKFNMFGDEE